MICSTPSCSASRFGVPLRQRGRARQTHGVGFDFLRKLMGDPSALEILGDGPRASRTSTSSDVVRAVLTIESRDARALRPSTSRPATTSQSVTSPRSPCQLLGLEPGRSTPASRRGSRLGKSDVPISTLYRQDQVDRWTCQRSSGEALTTAMKTCAGQRQRALVALAAHPAVFLDRDGARRGAHPRRACRARRRPERAAVASFTFAATCRQLREAGFD